MSKSRDRRRSAERAPAAPTDPRTARSAGRDPLADVAGRPEQEDAPPEALIAAGPAGELPLEPAGPDVSDAPPPAPPGRDTEPGAHAPRTPPRGERTTSAEGEGEREGDGDRERARPRRTDGVPRRPISEWPHERPREGPALDNPPG